MQEAQISHKAGAVICRPREQLRTLARKLVYSAKACQKFYIYIRIMYARVKHHFFLGVYF